MFRKQTEEILWGKVFAETPTEEIDFDDDKEINKRFNIQSEEMTGSKTGDCLLIKNLGRSASSVQRFWFTKRNE